MISDADQNFSSLLILLRRKESSSGGAGVVLTSSDIIAEVYFPPAPLVSLFRNHPLTK